MQTPQARFAKTASGTPVPYWLLGTGPPVLHFPSNPAMRFEADLELPEYEDWYDSLAQRVALVRFDSRGVWREQPEPGDFAMDALLADAESVLDATGHTSVAVFAIGHAAAAAVKLAATRPEAVSSLILWIPWTRGSDHYDTGSIPALHDLAEVDERMFGQSLGHMLLGWEAENAHRLGEWLEKNLSEPTLMALRADTAADDATAFHVEVAVPTLIVTGSDNNIVTPESILRMASEIPGARLASIPGSGVPQSEAAREYLRAEVIPLLVRAAESDSEPSGPFRTILFTDVENSTDLVIQHGDAIYRGLLADHERLVREALAEHGGNEIKTIGDSFMCWFSSASSAIDAASAMQRAITDHYGPELRIRIGIHAGEPIQEADGDLYGTSVVRASRIMGHADGGQILVSQVVTDLVEGKGYDLTDAGEFALKGYERAVHLFDVAWEAG